MAIDVIQQSPENHLRKVLSAVQSADLLLRHAQWEKGPAAL